MTQKKFISRGFFVFICLGLFSAITLFFGCSDQKKVVVFKSESAADILTAFIKSIEDADTTDNIVTVYVSKRGDSTFLFIADSYPEISKVQFNNIEVRGGYKIIYVGESDNSLFKVTKGEVPAFILEREKTRYSIEEPPKFLDPKQWEVYFINDKVVNAYPRDEIYKVIKQGK